MYKLVNGELALFTSTITLFFIELVKRTKVKVQKINIELPLNLNITLNTYRPPDGYEISLEHCLYLGVW